MAEIVVRSVEKGQSKPGQIVYAHFWNRTFIGKGRPEPGSNGHQRPRKNQTVRAYLMQRDGRLNAILPNGFTTVKSPADAQREP